MTFLSELIHLSEAVMQLSMMTMVGLYFAFSNTIMTSLKHMQNGAEFMVQINKVILNPLFLVFFALSGVSAAYFGLTQQGLLRISGILFFVGTIMVTVVKNVPLNNKLLNASSEESRQHVWCEYLHKWVFWNHVRTASSLGSVFLMVL